MHYCNRLVRQFGVGIEFFNRCIVPALYLAHEHFGESRSIDDKLTRLDTFQVHDRHDAAHDHRELGEAPFLQISTLQWRIACTERDRLVLDLLDATTGTYRLI